jgi:AcrR family transcriptional regulator
MSTDRRKKRSEERLARAEAKVAEALARADEKTAEALARAEEKTADALARAEGRAERALERAGSEAPADPIWARPEPGVRRAGYTRDQIAKTALAIADAEGFDAVSMRRVAAELGAGTMTLYHYVRNKDELIDLMDDAMMAEVIVPDGELPTHWREALAEIARRSLSTWTRHQWAKDQPPGVTIGPNGMRHFEQSLEAVAGTELSWLDKVEIINMVDDYVVGYILGQGEGGATPDELREKWVEPMARYLDVQLATGDFPNVQAMADELGGTRPAINRFVDRIGDNQHFERGLGRLLDGIEKYVESAKPKPRSGRGKRR